MFIFAIVVYLLLGYSMFCVCYGIYTRERSSPSVYFINNTKHCITYLALTQLFPVLVHILKCTYYAACCCISFRNSHFFFSHGCVHMGQMDFISSIFVRFFFSKLSGKHFIDHTLQMYRLISLQCLCIQP